MITVKLMPRVRILTMEAPALADYILHTNLVRIDYDHGTGQVILYFPQSPFDLYLSADEKMGWIRDFLGISMGGCCG